MQKAKKVTKKAKKSFKKVDKRPEFFRKPNEDVWVKTMGTLGTVQFWTGTVIQTLTFTVGNGEVNFAAPYPVPSIMSKVKRKTESKVFSEKKFSSKANVNKALAKAVKLGVGDEGAKKEAPEQQALKQLKEAKGKKEKKEPNKA